MWGSEPHAGDVVPFCQASRATSLDPAAPPWLVVRAALHMRETTEPEQASSAPALIVVAHAEQADQTPRLLALHTADLTLRLGAAILPLAYQVLAPGNGIRNNGAELCKTPHS